MSSKSNKTTTTAVSGQQVGLLGGSLFILYKILGVYRLATTHKLKPVFWLEGNDADLNEIRFFYGLDKDNNINSYSWNPQQLRGQPIGNYVVDKELLDLFKNYFSLIKSSPYTNKVKDLVFSSYIFGIDLLSANENFFKNLFSEVPGFNTPEITWFRSDHEQFRNFSQQLLLKEIATTLDGEQCKTFALVEGKREALFKKGNNYITRQQKVINPEEVILLPTVWNRSLLQDDFLRARYYVGGPGEIKYLLELLPRYKQFNITPAEVISRMSLTIADKRSEEYLKKFGMDIKTYLTSNYTFWQSTLQKRYFVSKESLFDERKRLMQEKNQHVTEKSQEFLNQNILSVKTKLKQFEKNQYLEIKHKLGKKRKEFNQAQIRERKQLQQYSNFLRPAIHPNQHFPQERFHNIVTLLNVYGFEVISQIYKEYDFTKKVLIV